MCLPTAFYAEAGGFFRVWLFRSGVIALCNHSNTSFLLIIFSTPSSWLLFFFSNTVYLYASQLVALCIRVRALVHVMSIVRVLLLCDCRFLRHSLLFSFPVSKTFPPSLFVFVRVVLPFLFFFPPLFLSFYGIHQLLSFVWS